jgi:hypothetical protein
VNGKKAQLETSSGDRDVICVGKFIKQIQGVARDSSSADHPAVSHAPLDFQSACATF